jgi:hypothetical protein
MGKQFHKAMKKILIASFFIALSCCLHAADLPPGITVVYEAKKKAVLIRWQQKQPGVKTFIVQRSNNNSEWEDIALQVIAEFNPAKLFQYYDYKSSAGENYYRLKCVGDKGQTEYSTSIMVITSAANSNWVMYPVPVKDMLTLMYKGADRIKGVVNVFIHNVTGRVITKVRSGSLNTSIQIPVSNLGSGIYDVRIVIEDEIVWNQRFIK